MKVTERCFTPCLLCCVDPHAVMVKINTELLTHHSPLVHTVFGPGNWPHLTIMLSCVMSNTRGARQQLLAGCLRNDPCRPRSAAHWKTAIITDKQDLSCSLSVEPLNCSSSNNTEVQTNWTYPSIGPYSQVLQQSKSRKGDCLSLKNKKPIKPNVHQIYHLAVSSNRLLDWMQSDFSNTTAVFISSMCVSALQYKLNLPTYLNKAYKWRPLVLHVSGLVCSFDCKFFDTHANKEPELSATEKKGITHQRASRLHRK